MSKIKIRRPDDFHVHFREWPILPHVAAHTAFCFARATVMPNTLNPPIKTAEDASEYRKKIERCTRCWGFTPLMTIKLYSDTTPAMILGAHQAGVTAVKLYPEGVTTNAEDGVSVDDVETLYPALEAMEKCGLLLLLHGEMPGVFCMDREVSFHRVVRKIVSTFPKLKVVLEHITCAETVHFVQAMPDTVAATITLHHLEMTLDDVVGDKIQPHNFCKPVAKRPEDRLILVKTVLSGNPKFFFGSDSAPHPLNSKECAEGCAGVFTSPIALPRLAEFFEHHEALDWLENFISRFGAEFYGLPLNKEGITLVREPWTIPMDYCGVRPYLAGQKLQWKVTNP